MYKYIYICINIYIYTMAIEDFGKLRARTETYETNIKNDCIIHPQIKQETINQSIFFCQTKKTCLVEKGAPG